MLLMMMMIELTLQAQTDLQQTGVDMLRTDNEVEREISNFEQTKLRDIKVFGSAVTCLCCIRIKLHCFA